MWPTSSSSSSRSSLSSSASSSNITNNINNHNNENPLRPAKTMEEVWQDISFIASDLPHHHQCHTSSRGVILLDFFSNIPPPPNSSLPLPPPPPIHPTMLTLSSAPDDHFNSLLLQHQQLPISNVTFDAAVPLAAAVGKKRFPELEKCSGDLRHKRMIKNRDSATRSRARKQESAYTNELELKLEELKEENAMLKKQQEQLLIAAAAAAQNQKKKSLNRASTAPF